MSKKLLIVIAVVLCLGFVYWFWARDKFDGSAKTLEKAYSSEDAAYGD